MAGARSPGVASELCTVARSAPRACPGRACPGRACVRAVRGHWHFAGHTHSGTPSVPSRCDLHSSAVRSRTRAQFFKKHTKNKSDFPSSSSLFSVQERVARMRARGLQLHPPQSPNVLPPRLLLSWQPLQLHRDPAPSGCGCCRSTRASCSSCWRQVRVRAVSLL